jgi:hypothetical protein
MTGAVTTPADGLSAWHRGLACRQKGAREGRDAATALKQQAEQEKNRQLARTNWDESARYATLHGDRSEGSADGGLAITILAEAARAVSFIP